MKKEYTFLIIWIVWIDFKKQNYQQNIRFIVLWMIIIYPMKIIDMLEIYEII